MKRAYGSVREIVADCVERGDTARRHELCDALSTHPVLRTCACDALLACLVRLSPPPGGAADAASTSSVSAAKRRRSDCSDNAAPRYWSQSGVASAASSVAAWCYAEEQGVRCFRRLVRRLPAAALQRMLRSSVVSDGSAPLPSRAAAQRRRGTKRSRQSSSALDAATKRAAVDGGGGGGTDMTPWPLRLAIVHALTVLANDESGDRQQQHSSFADAARGDSLITDRTVRSIREDVVAELAARERSSSATLPPAALGGLSAAQVASVVHHAARGLRRALVPPPLPTEGGAAATAVRIDVARCARTIRFCGGGGERCPLEARAAALASAVDALLSVLDAGRHEHAATSSPIETAPPPPPALASPLSQSVAERQRVAPMCSLEGLLFHRKSPKANAEADGEAASASSAGAAAGGGGSEATGAKAAPRSPQPSSSGRGEAPRDAGAAPRGQVSVCLTRLAHLADGGEGRAIAGAAGEVRALLCGGGGGGGDASVIAADCSIGAIARACCSVDAARRDCSTTKLLIALTAPNAAAPFAGHRFDGRGTEIARTATLAMALDCTIKIVHSALLNSQKISRRGSSVTSAALPPPADPADASRFLAELLSQLGVIALGGTCGDRFELPSFLRIHLLEMVLSALLRASATLETTTSVPWAAAQHTRGTSALIHEVLSRIIDSINEPMAGSASLASRSTFSKEPVQSLSKLGHTCTTPSVAIVLQMIAARSKVAVTTTFADDGEVPEAGAFLLRRYLPTLLSWLIGSGCGSSEISRRESSSAIAVGSLRDWSRGASSIVNAIPSTDVAAAALARGAIDLCKRAATSQVQVQATRGLQLLLLLCIGENESDGQRGGIPLLRVLSVLVQREFGSLNPSSLSCSVCNIRACRGNCVHFDERAEVALSIAQAAHTYVAGFSFRTWMRSLVLSALSRSLHGDDETTVQRDGGTLRTILALVQRSAAATGGGGASIISVTATALHDAVAKIDGSGIESEAWDKAKAVIDATLRSLEQTSSSFAQQQAQGSSAAASSPSSSQSAAQIIKLNQMQRGSHTYSSPALMHAAWNTCVAALEQSWGGVTSDIVVRKVLAMVGQGGSLVPQTVPSAAQRCLILLSMIEERVHGWRVLESSMMRPTLFASGLVARALERWSPSPNTGVGLDHTTSSSLELEISLGRLMSVGVPVHVGDLAKLLFDAALRSSPERARLLAAAVRPWARWLPVSTLQQCWRSLLSETTLSQVRCYGAMQLLLLASSAAKDEGDELSESPRSSIVLMEAQFCAFICPFRHMRVQRPGSDADANSASVGARVSESSSVILTHLVEFLMNRHPHELVNAKALRQRVAWLVLGAVDRGFAGTPIVRRWRQRWHTVWGSNDGDDDDDEEEGEGEGGVLDRMRAVASAVSPAQWLEWEFLEPSAAVLRGYPCPHPCRVEGHLATLHFAKTLSQHYDAALESMRTDFFNGSHRALMSHLLPRAAALGAARSDGFSLRSSLSESSAALSSAISRQLHCAVRDEDGGGGGHWLANLLHTVSRALLTEATAATEQILLHCIPPEALLTVAVSSDAAAHSPLKVVRLLLLAADEGDGDGGRGTDITKEPVWVDDALGEWCGSGGKTTQRAAGRRRKKGQGRRRQMHEKKSAPSAASSAASPADMSDGDAGAPFRKSPLLELSIRAIDAAYRESAAGVGEEAEALLQHVVAKNDESQEELSFVVERLRPALSPGFLTLCASLRIGKRVADGGADDPALSPDARGVHTRETGGKTPRNMFTVLD